MLCWMDNGVKKERKGAGSCRSGVCGPCFRLIREIESESEIEKVRESEGARERRTERGKEKERIRESC